ncbi:hypothetical protein BDY19DRAFT_918947 [Irpex rosettiformis]|uniref:Uncharacterized protein n=1 Tax=Irpex rosettiformis TaxID=378272 RepID=A0ACB8UHL1_9APHY|nr:hypothetical protein BDY19DRAFT_918947 [Irpex rosettiformis]
MSNASPPRQWPPIGKSTVNLPFTDSSLPASGTPPPFKWNPYTNSIHVTNPDSDVNPQATNVKSPIKSLVRKDYVDSEKLQAALTVTTTSQSQNSSTTRTKVISEPIALVPIYSAGEQGAVLNQAYTNAYGSQPSLHTISSSSTKRTQNHLCPGSSRTSLGKFSWEKSESSVGNNSVLETTQAQKKSVLSTVSSHNSIAPARR